MDQIPFVADKINVKMPDVSFGTLIFDNYANPPLRFLLKLFCLQLVSPLMFFAMKRINKDIVIGALIALVVADIIFNFGYSNFFHWIPVYFGAGFIGIYNNEFVENECEKWLQQKRWIVLLCTVGIFLLGVFIKSVQWITAPVVRWGVMSCIKTVPYKDFMKESFFVFCTYYFLILIVRKLFVILLGVSLVKMVVAYFVTFALVILISTLIGMIIN